MITWLSCTDHGTAHALMTWDAKTQAERAIAAMEEAAAALEEVKNEENI